MVTSSSEAVATFMGHEDSRYALMRQTWVKRLYFRSRIWERDAGTCQLCGEPAEYFDMHLDHIQPRSLGGEDTWSNLQIAHGACNESKGNRIR